jgi:DNA-binding GntR family transcriptional regulator
MVVYWHHLRRAMGEVLQRRAEARRVWDEHAVIVEGIARHDERAASSLALAHVRGAADRVAGSIPAAQLAGSAPERRGAAARRQ